MTAFIADYRNDTSNWDDAHGRVSVPQWLADDFRPAVAHRGRADVRKNIAASRAALRTQGRPTSRPRPGRPSNRIGGDSRPNTRGTGRPSNAVGPRSNTADHRRSPVRGPIQGVRRTPGAIAAAVGLGLVFGAMMHFSGFGAPEAEPAQVAPTYVGAADSVAN